MSADPLLRSASYDAPVAEFAGQLFFRLWRASHTRAAEAFETIGLTPALFALLNVIGAREGAIQQKLGTMLGIDPSTMVSLIDRLESAGLAKRRPSRRDRRAREVVITAKGRRQLERARKMVLEVEDEVLGGLSAGERDELTGAATPRARVGSAAAALERGRRGLSAATTTVPPVRTVGATGSRRIECCVTWSRAQTRQLCPTVRAHLCQLGASAARAKPFPATCHPPPAIATGAPDGAPVLPHPSGGPPAAATGTNASERRAVALVRGSMSQSCLTRGECYTWL
jgi:DNA-binding MarR family transcriptional regulator